MLVFLISLATNVVSVRMFGYWDLPPKNMDSVDYDNIAVCLATGLGFGHDWGNPQFRQPYIDHNPGGRYDRHLERGGPYSPTAYRPPAMPFLLSVLYKIFGRGFLMWRLFNCVVVSLAVTLAVSLAWRVGGAKAGTISTVTILLDPLLKKYAGYFLTEGLAYLGVMLLVWALVLLIERQRVLYAALGGVAMAGLILVRSLFVLWCPLVLLLIVGCRLWGGEKKRLRPSALAAVAFLAPALLLPLPWWVRNCLVLDSFMPLGTQGGAGLPGGYSDATVAAKGMWINVAAFGAFDPLYARIEGLDLTLLEQEREEAQFGTRLALDWIVQHPLGVIKLMGYKLYTLWTRPKVYAPLLLVLACLGLSWAWGLCRSRVMVLWGFVAINSLVVAATYITSDGRFLTPVLLILHILVGIGLWRAGQWLERSRQHRGHIAQSAEG